MHAYLLRFWSEDKVVFESASVTEDNLTRFAMNGHATFRIVCFFSRQKWTNLNERGVFLIAGELSTYAHCYFHAKIRFVRDHVFYYLKRGHGRREERTLLDLFNVHFRVSEASPSTRDSRELIPRFFHA